MIQRLKEEPAAIMGVIQTALVVIVLFGFKLSPQQSAGILALSAAVLALITRKMVTPSAKLPKPPAAPDDAPKVILKGGIVLALLLCMGCAAAIPVLKSITEGVNWFATVIDAADAGTTRYFDRHPNMETESMVAGVFEDLQDAADLLSEAADAGESAAAGEYEQARKDALAAYARLRTLLAATCVLRACAPDGGAENTDAPQPTPLELPTTAEVASRI